ncbi:hypothetical protein, partial [Enterococcus faecium]|uniref:hypothetical protein n=1 Tax=Enterococcus faecium TaxID=1352 RepID=UPI001C84145A
VSLPQVQSNTQNEPLTVPYTYVRTSYKKVFQILYEIENKDVVFYEAVYDVRDAKKSSEHGGVY